MRTLTSQNTDFLSNTYLLVDEETATAALIDAGGPVQPLLTVVEDSDLSLTHVLLTHHHYDHVCELDRVTAFAPQVAIYAHPYEGERLDIATRLLADGERISVGNLRVDVLHTPGHTDGMLAFFVHAQPGRKAALFTGDTLFRGSVGGVRAPGHGTYEQLRHSITERILTLDKETIIYPGHSDTTTVAREWEENPFVRLWRGLDEAAQVPCRVFEKTATLVLQAPDYDGGTKAWIRWPDGSDDIVPGSRVEKL